MKDGVVPIIGLVVWFVLRSIPAYDYAALFRIIPHYPAHYSALFGTIMRSLLQFNQSRTRFPKLFVLSSLLVVGIASRVFGPSRICGSC